MKVQLYVYDLSRGLARQMSQQFLGTHIEAVYHTSLVFGGIEYYFGASIQTSYPGSTHHGQPMEVITMGTTELPLELILEYMDSLRSVYSAESYDLFLHNCNNFTNDFAMFLVGKGIPDHITSLPRRVLDTPFGQMLRPQLDSAMRGITQSSSAPLPGAQMNGAPKPPTQGTVKNITRLSELTSLLQSAPAAVLFFTSATCPPCKICYPIYDTLAADYPTQIALIKIDTSAGYEIAKQYGIRATPTFITYLKGEKFEEWSGADASRLESTIRLLVQMSAAPVHRHRNLRLPTLQRKQKPITFTKMPPLEKLLGKLDPKVASSVEVQGLKDFISSNPKINSQSKGNSGPPALPDLPALSTFILSLLDTTPLEKLFPLIDLLRLAVLDRRVASFFLLASKDASKSLLPTLLTHLNNLTTIPHALHLVSLHLLTNLTSTSSNSPSSLSSPLTTLSTSSLLQESPTPQPSVVHSSASLLYNLILPSHTSKITLLENSTSTSSGEKNVDDADDIIQIEMAAGIVEALRRFTTSAPKEPSKTGAEDTTLIKRLLLSLGMLAYESASEVGEVLEAMDAKEVVRGIRVKEVEGVVKEVLLVL